MSGTPRRPPVFGPEPWTTIAGLDWCHFDRWFAIVAAGDFGGDLDALEAVLIGRLRSLHGRGDVEAKLSHLADLRDRLRAAGIDAAVLAAADEPDKATVIKARRKVLDHGLEDRAMTPAMHDTPSARLRRRAPLPGRRGAPTGRLVAHRRPPLLPLRQRRTPLGSDHWMPIVALAESAAAAGRNELAIEVFRAADQPGMQRNHLRERCLRLTGIRLDDPQPPLRVVG